MADRLTAPAGSIPRRGPGGRLTLADCFRDFMRRPSPRIVALALVAVLAARLVAGHWSWRDALIAGVLVALQPFTEWVIHVYLPPSRPVRIGGRHFDLPAAKEHRDHHESPADLDGVLIPRVVIVIVLALVVAVAFGLGF